MELFQKYEHLLIEEVCRLCLGKKDGMRLISETGLSNMLLEYASIQVYRLFLNLSSLFTYFNCRLG